MSTNSGQRGSMVGEQTGAFAGVRVVELAQYVFVPAAAAVLNDLGADVIKIEPPNGDPYRGLHAGITSGSMSTRFHHANRGKRSIGVDVRCEEGREILLQLVEEADVFVTSVRPAALERAGLGVDDLRARNARLIYCRGHGLGLRGPDAGRPGFDATAYWARGGLAGALGPGLDGRPIRQLPAMGDNPAAMNLAFAIATALFERERTGVARIVDVSLLSTALWTLANEAVAVQEAQQSPSNPATPSGWNPLTEAYETRDGRWVQLVLLDPDRYWVELCSVLGRPELADDDRFADSRARQENADACMHEISAVFHSADFDDWRRRLASFGGAWEPILTVGELLGDGQVEANGYLAHLDGSSVRLVAPPAQFDELPIGTRRAPTFGADTEDILAHLGYKAAAVEQLRSRGVVA